VSRRLTTVLSATVLASALVLSACGEEAATKPTSAAISAVTVKEGAPAKAPTVTVKAPLTVSKTESDVVKDGTGAVVAKDDLISIQAVIVNGRDGKVAHSTWETGAVGLDLGAQDLFPSFKSQLTGKKIGSRVVITSTPADAFGDTGNESIGVKKDDPVVFVVDLVGSAQALKEATGKAVAPKAGLPTVTMTAGKPATINVKGVKPPTATIVQPLIEGTGPEVKKGQTVRVAYTGALLKDGSVFDSSASRPEQPYFDFPIGGQQVIKGWDNGLIGQKVGSRVLLVIPPADGYGTAGSPPKISGTDNLVFVVDILAAF
jgi:peptidylprolyl isomerase